MSDPVIQDQLSFFVDYQVLGLPFGPAWAEHPAAMIDVIKALKEEEAAVMEDERRMKQGAGGDG